MPLQTVTQEYRVKGAAIDELRRLVHAWSERHRVQMPVLLWVLERVHKEVSEQFAEQTGGGFISRIEQLE